MVEQYLASNQPRVLIIENDPGWRIDHKKNLTRWGYQPFIVEAQGESLLQDAYHKAHQYRCHLALVDMRLFDHDDHTDHSGLNLVPKLKPTESVIVSGYGNMSTVRTALIEKGAKHFVGKEEGPELLKQVLEEVAQSTCAARRELKIEWLAGLSVPAILYALFPCDSNVPADQVLDVLARLFPDAKRLQVQRLHSPIGMTNAFSRADSIVLKVYIDELVQPQVVRIANAQDINTEYRRYKDYIEGRLGSNNYARLQKHVCLWDIGGARYDFMGTFSEAMPSFREHYQSNQSVEQIVEPLKFFFDQLWSRYYLTQSDSSRQSLFEDYGQVWGKSWHQKLQELSRQAQSLSYPMLNLDLPAPASWIQKMVEQYQTSDMSIIPKSRQAITHGALTGEHLLVDDGRAWVIHYQQTGLGPILRDVVSLEVDILTCVARLSLEELPLIYELAVALTAPTHIGQALEITSGIINHAEARKAFTVIRTLRELTMKHIGPYDQAEYLWGLLLQSSKIAMELTKEHPQHTKSNLLAGIICMRLDRWRGLDWPPATWPQVKWMTVAQEQEWERMVKRLLRQLERRQQKRRIYEPNVPPNLMREIEQLEEEARQLGVLLPAH